MLLFPSVSPAGRRVTVHSRVPFWSVPSATWPLVAQRKTPLIRDEGGRAGRGAELRLGQWAAARWGALPVVRRGPARRSSPRVAARRVPAVPRRSRSREAETLRRGGSTGR